MVTIIEKNNRLLERHLSVMGALFLQKHLKNVGVELVFNASLERMVHKDGSVHAVILAHGEKILTDMIIIAAGVQPNSALAHTAGLELHRNYVMVNEYMQTSDGAIYAAGDVAIMHDQTIGILAPTTTWIDAAQQGMIAAHTMTGIAKPYTGTVSLINSHFFGLYFASMAIEGHAERTEHNRQEYIVKELKYIDALVRDEILLGFHYIGDNSTEIASLRRAIALKKNINDLISLW